MSEPFYYGPWDIEKIQNDIKELQEGGGSGGGLPYFFPPYFEEFKIEESTDGVTYTEIPIPNYVFTEGYFNQQIDFSVPMLMLNESTYFKITCASPSKGYAFYSIDNGVDTPEIDNLIGVINVTAEDHISSVNLYISNSETPTDNDLEMMYNVVFER